MPGASLYMRERRSPSRSLSHTLGGRTKAWCLLIRTEASLSHLHGEEGGSLEPPYTRGGVSLVAADDSRILRAVLVRVCVAGAIDGGGGGGALTGGGADIARRRSPPHGVVRGTRTPPHGVVRGARQQRTRLVQQRPRRRPCAPRGAQRAQVHAKGPPHHVRHVVGCHVTQTTRVQTACR